MSLLYFVIIILNTKITEGIFLKILVSIIMPTYNHGDYISKAINSVINQTYNYWELIIIDNNSSDNTELIIGSYDDKRIKHIKINNHGIIGASRNRGLEEAEGDLIAFLDSDDWWDKSKLELSLNEIYRDKDIVYHDLILESTSKKYFFQKLMKKYQVKKPVIIDLLTLGNPIATSSVLVKKKILLAAGGMSEDPNMVGAEDYNTWIRVSQITDQFKYIPKFLGGYLIHNRGISKKDITIPMRAAVTDFLHVLNEKQLNAIDARLNYIKGRHFYSDAKHKEAKYHLMRCLYGGDIYMRLRAIMMLINIKLILYYEK